MVVGSDPEEGLAELVGLLDGCRSREDIERHARRAGIDLQRVSDLLGELHRVRLLDDRRSPPSRRGPHLRLVGAGAVGKAVADLLAARVERLHLVDSDPTDTSLYPTAATLMTQSDALQAHLRGTLGSRASVWNHWSKPHGRRLDLTVITTAMAETDRVVPEDLLRSDQPHVFIRVTATSAVVGPLVIPGTTACLHCTDLYRCDRDPAWASLLNQLTRVRARPDPLLTAWAAANAVTQVLAFLDGEQPESWSATLELSARDHRTRWRHWPRHPACGCDWSPAPG